MLRTILLCFFLLAATPGFAGGSWIPVRVESLTMASETDYTLVVIPEPLNHEDWFLGNCTRFEVRGSFSTLDGEPWFIPWHKRKPSREEHMAALVMLKKAKDEKSLINFGWMGTGFKVIDANNPCIVESRGLETMSEKDMTSVVSYFNQI